MAGWIVGIDEAGRGPLAGPVTVAAVAVIPTYKLQTTNCQLRDSKQLTAQQREAIYGVITSNKNIRWACASVGSFVIDRIGIVAALDLAVARVLEKLFPNPYSLIPFVLLDGSLYAPRHFRQCTLIKGDEQIGLIAAASIVAKVRRDALMVQHHRRFPQYGFEQHKGYGTRLHYKALKQFGPCPLHRRTFLAKTS